MKIRKVATLLCFIFLASALLVTGCKSHNDLELASSSVQPGSTPTRVTGDPYRDGFTLRARRPDPGTSWTRETWPIAYQSRSQIITDSPAYRNADPATMFALDRGYTDDGEVIFVWPSADEKIDRDHDRVGELMNEYGELVGTLLGRRPVGDGEMSWRNWIRSVQLRRINQVRSKGADAFCQEVVNQLIDRFVPQGSTYRQYGNCGEGGLVGACLATRAGFKEDEIRICVSANDHMFAMFREDGDDPDRDWCILDRWDLIGRYNCGVNLNEKTKVVTLNGKDQADQNWFQKVKCAPFDQYLDNPSVVWP